MRSISLSGPLSTRSAVSRPEICSDGNHDQHADQMARFPDRCVAKGESCLSGLVSGRDAGLGAKHALQSSKLRAHKRPRLAADDAPGDTTKNTVEEIDA